jgi:hypothetical protein
VLFSALNTLERKNKHQLSALMITFIPLLLLTVRENKKNLPFEPVIIKGPFTSLVTGLPLLQR